MADAAEATGTEPTQPQPGDSAGAASGPAAAVAPSSSTSGHRERPAVVAAAMRRPLLIPTDSSSQNRRVADFYQIGVPVRMMMNPMPSRTGTLNTPDAGRRWAVEGTLSLPTQDTVVLYGCKVWGEAQLPMLAEYDVHMDRKRKEKRAAAKRGGAASPHQDAGASQGTTDTAPFDGPAAGRARSGAASPPPAATVVGGSNRRSGSIYTDHRDPLDLAPREPPPKFVEFVTLPRRGLKATRATLRTPPASAEEPPRQLVRLYVRRYLIHNDNGRNPTHTSLEDFIRQRTGWLHPDAIVLKGIEVQERHRLRTLLDTLLASTDTGNAYALTRGRDMDINQRRSFRRGGDDDDDEGLGLAGSGSPDQFFNRDRVFSRILGLVSLLAVAGIADALYGASLRFMSNNGTRAPLRRFFSSLPSMPLSFGIYLIAACVSSALLSRSGTGFSVRKWTLLRLVVSLLGIAFGTYTIYLLIASVANLREPMTDTTLEDSFTLALQTLPGDMCTFYGANHCAGWKQKCSEEATTPSLTTVSPCLSGCSNTYQYGDNPCYDTLVTSVRISILPLIVITIIAVVLSAVDVVHSCLFFASACLAESERMQQESQPSAPMSDGSPQPASGPAAAADGTQQRDGLASTAAGTMETGGPVEPPPSCFTRIRECLRNAWCCETLDDDLDSQSSAQDARSEDSD